MTFTRFFSKNARNSELFVHKDFFYIKKVWSPRKYFLTIPDYKQSVRFISGIESLSLRHRRTVVELVSKNVHVKIFSTFSPKRLSKIFETLRFQW